MCVRDNLVYFSEIKETKSGIAPKTHHFLAGAHLSSHLWSRNAKAIHKEET
jgi:hypothetical protein